MTSFLCERNRYINIDVTTLPVKSKQMVIEFIHCGLVLGMSLGCQYRTVPVRRKNGAGLIGRLQSEMLSCVIFERTICSGEATSQTEVPGFKASQKRIQKTVA